MKQKIKIKILMIIFVGSFILFTCIDGFLNTLMLFSITAGIISCTVIIIYWLEYLNKKNFRQNKKNRRRI